MLIIQLCAFTSFDIIEYNLLSCKRGRCKPPYTRNTDTVFTVSRPEITLGEVYTLYINLLQQTHKLEGRKHADIQTYQYGFVWLHFISHLTMAGTSLHH